MFTQFIAAWRQTHNVAEKRRAMRYQAEQLVWCSPMTGVAHPGRPTIGSWLSH